MLFLNRTDEKDKFGRYLSLFECPECGQIKKVHASNGRRDKTCGCVLTPRHARTEENKRLYECWVNMKTRCGNPKYHKSHRYSERGITLCVEWSRFLPFQDWALKNGYENKLQIDRIDNDKGYYPGNCRWVNNTVNHRNSSAVKLNIDIAETIRKEREAGTSEAELSLKYKVCRRQINNIVERRQWI